MDLAPKTEQFSSDSKAWLGSEHGTTSCDSIMLDAALFLAVFPDGNVPSGVVLGRVTATGRYAPYDDGAATGIEVARGHLFDLVQVQAGVNPAGALFWHGEVIEAKLPDDHGLDAAAKADLPQIKYV
jgi:hypothetical protein